METHWNAISVFLSYAHEDEPLLRQLETHLSLLKRQGLISTWYDRQIVPGTSWAEVIDERLEQASIILLLVSPDFLASDYCYQVEMKRALERHEADQARVIPIALRPADWKGAPFAHLQALPTGAKAITTWRNRDRAFVDVAAGIRRTIEDLPLLPANLPRAALPAIWNMPYRRNPYFTGREDILEKLFDVLRAGKTVAITQPQAISGLGGIGKTQIAVEYAYRYYNDYQAILWVRAETHELLVSDFVVVAGLLNLPEKDVQDQNEAIEAVKRWLKEHKDWLLILDNADDLAMVQGFLPLVGKGHILLTTRAHATGRIAQPIEVEKMAPEEGALFLLHRATILDAYARFEDVPRTDQQIAREIVQAMDGLPLALDQAGAYIEETSCGLRGYLDLYRTQGAKLLKERGGLETAYPESVATTWSLSFKNVEQANAAAAELLRFCAFLAPEDIPEEFFTESATGLGPTLEPDASDPSRFNAAVRELLKYSLVQRDSETYMLSIHRLVQEVLKDQMEEKTQRLWAERAVRVVEQSFPDVEVENWHICQWYLPHALLCSAYIKQWDMTFPEARALLFRVGHYYYQRVEYADAEPLWKHALTISERVLGPDHLETAATLNTLANLFTFQHKYEQAEPLYQRTLMITERELGPDHFRMADNLNNLAINYKDQGKYEQAEPLYQRALMITERELGPDHPGTAMKLQNLATLYADQGKYEQAEPLYQQALMITERELGPDRPETAGICYNLATIYEDQGKYEQAEPLYQRALTIREQMLGPDHPTTVQNLRKLATLYAAQATLYAAQGKYEQAELFYQRDLAITEQMLGPDHPDAAKSFHDLATLYANQGKDEQAEAFYQRALTIYERVLGPDHPNIADSLNDLATLYANQGEYGQAEPLYQRALAIRERQLGPEHPAIARSLNNLALLYANLGKYEQAKPLYQRAIALNKIVLGPEHPDTVAVQENYHTLVRNMKQRRKGKR